MPMRILFVIPELSIGGTERQLLILARELRAMGHTPRVLALRPARRPLALDEGLDIRVIDAPRPYDPRCLPRFLREIRAFRPDVLHTFLSGFDLWANLAARMLHVPCAVSSRREIARWQQRRHRALQSAANLLVDGVVANSLAAADYCCAVERFLHRGMVHVVPNAYEPRPQPPAPVPPGDGDAIRIVNIANFWPGKGHDVLVRAFAQVRPSFPSARLWLVGEGPEQGRVAALAAEMGLAESVRFLGRRTDIDAILRGAALYVHAALSESSPNAVLEAMANGVSVVAFAAGGVPELLDGGESGALVQVGDGDALSAAIRDALENPERARERAAHARESVAARHTPQTMAAAYERIYSGIVARRTGERPAPKQAALYTIGDITQPSTRYRILQFVPALQEAGYAVTQFGLGRPGGGRFRGALGLLAHAPQRWRQLRQAGRFDAVVIQKGLTPCRWSGLARSLFASGTPYIVDVDDAILEEPLPIRFPWPLRLLQNPSEPSQLVSRARRVIAGNRHLAGLMGNGALQVTIIPTVVDCRRYWCSSPAGTTHRGFRIVWAGQRSTLPYLLGILPAVRAAAETVPSGEGVVLRVICDAFPGLSADDSGALRIERVRWSLDREIDDLAGADAGLMPLPDDQWTRGKCGFKALQYMALGIAPIVSPVGVNAEIVEDGVNGLHATTPSEWESRLRLLAGDAALRRRLGLAARQTVVERYSLARWATPWVRELERIRP